MVYTSHQGHYWEAQAQHCSSCIHGHQHQGLTSLKFVSGTHKHPNTYVSAKGGNHKGVGQEEYGEVLTYLFIPEGMQLFQQAGKWSGKWQLQQDNATPHKTVTNLDLIRDRVPT